MTNIFFSCNVRTGSSCSKIQMKGVRAMFEQTSKSMGKAGIFSELISKIPLPTRATKRRMFWSGITFIVFFAGTLFRQEIMVFFAQFTSN
ncbi:MAG: hypothetical protein UY01_C0039G0005 [Candidatus Nomurabacteria bacterium GW2011_GWB1_47_6]|uniref:Uncharacterized protein n=1 Tax=Candidatus Nomurabacteria bacterium GW2011_GWB1_47_6 TaxID=1618749 RepID=A0A0G1VW28_9BACT|nr:MAG: hypothetical protein UY01_C0039G0005 [Candidatus Nomurabacteria bacterium GW2011_GWB1_47_6]